MKTAKELKPICPYCGGKTEYIEYNFGDREHKENREKL